MVQKNNFFSRALSADGNKWRKDIAIMMSQIFAACGSWLSKKATLTFMEVVIKILDDLYNLIRDSKLSSDRYWSSMNLDCCQRWDKHMAMGIYVTSRRLLIGALERRIFDEALISVCVNFFMAELTVIEPMDCRIRERLLWSANKNALQITNNLPVNQKHCKRSIRTVTKFLSIKTNSKYWQRSPMLTKLLELHGFLKETSEQIKINAVKVLCTEPAYRIRAMFDLTTLQSEHPDTKFETIVTILNELGDICYGINLKFNPLDLFWLQLRTEIEYPKLNTLCKQKLVDEIQSYIDTHESVNTNESISNIVNFVKANMYILSFQIGSRSSIEALKKIEFKFYSPFDRIVSEITLQYEGNQIKLLMKSLNCFSTILSQKDSWTIDEPTKEFISNMVTMLYKVGNWLKCRQYNAAAVKAFELLYQAATMANNIVKQTLAAGFLVENGNLLIPMEMVKVLSNNIILQLKSLDKMTRSDQSDFLLAILHLSMHTLRFDKNVEAAKKYMQVINKLLEKYDPDQTQFTSVRLKYSHVMLELIINESDTNFTPILYVEDIFHRFKAAKFSYDSDCAMLPGIMFDTLSSLYAYTQARHEFISPSGLLSNLWYVAIRAGYSFLLSKVMIVSISHSLYTENEAHSKVSEFSAGQLKVMNNGFYFQISDSNGSFGYS